MISICIPVYNSDVRQLVNDLYEQTANLKGEQAEIIVIDDCSKETFKRKNTEVASKCELIELQKNVGRAAIRNFFLEKSTGDQLLFLDGDSKIISDDFLQKYVDLIREKSGLYVVVGASIYQKEKPSLKYRLRWKYSTNRESKSLKERLLLPGLSFKTNNFLIQREVFQKIRFEERVKGYGHEDTLFGFRLKQAGIKIEHIENPVLNPNLDDNKTFLKKTDNALKNLVWICRKVGFEDEFIRHVKLLKMTLKLRKNLFFRMLLFSSIPLTYLLRFLFSLGFANLKLFDFYRMVRLNLLFSKK